MKATYLGHSAVLLQSQNYKILIDPFLKYNPQYIPDPNHTSDITHILVTHAHGDHIGDSIQIAKDTGALIVCNAEIGTILRSIDQTLKIHPMHIGGRAPFDFGTIKMTPALHGSGYVIDGKIYDGGNPCGYLIKILDKTIYHAGDTGLTYDMKLLENSLIDLAFLPIGGNYTMDIDDAVIAADFIKSEKVVPIHFNTFDGIEADPYEFKETVKGSEVVILNPNESIKI